MTADTRPAAAAERLAPDDPRLSFDGVGGWSRGPAGALPLRMPLERLATAMSPGLDRVARTAAGIRFAVRTDAARITLETETDPGGAPLDIRVDGVLVHRWSGGPGPQRVDFPLPPAARAPAEVEVWLPHLGVTRLVAVAFHGHRTLAAVERTGPRWAAYGSSLTQCVFASGPSETWPAIVAAGRGWRLRNLGFAGEAYLDPVVARTLRDAPAELISLELGINAYIRGAFTARTWGSAVCGFVDTVRDGHPDTPVAVITPLSSPDREQSLNTAGLTLRDARALTEEAVRVLQRLGDRALHLVDGLALAPVKDAPALYADGLHPSAEGEHVLAERIGTALDAIPLPRRP
ncbi:GDSL-type esterase/lipase family protein [Streptomyces sp. NPDC014894]|uniref:GDSL-type esterase/lipase family protein n=1 Tax=Streptomyces sp. NPDC014894 TaxID=3364931 RepID=UPI0037022849